MSSLPGLALCGDYKGVAPWTLIESGGTEPLADPSDAPK